MDIINGPCESLGLMIAQMNILGAELGMRVLQPEYTMLTKEFILLAFSATSFIFSTGYTLSKVSGDFVATIFCLVTLGMYTQCLSKIYVFLVHRIRILELTHHFHEIYQRNVNQFHRKIILDQYVRYSWTAFRAIKALNFVAGFFLVCSPLITGMALGERMLPFGFYLPYLDHTSTPGYELTYLYMVVLIWLAIHGISASDGYFVLHIFLGMGHLAMMSEMVRDLNKLLQEKVYHKSASLEEKIEVRIKEILFEHQEHFRFTRTFGVIFSSLSLIVVGCASAVIVMCLVVLVKEFWVLGFVLIAMVLWQIIFVCAMGTAFESSCLWFSEGLYTMDWFLLAPKHRKYWRMLIQMAHRPHLVTLGSVWTANLNMFMVVMRHMYSILMMLFRMAD